MPALLTPPWTPPQESQQLDRQHPLAAQLAGCWLFTERGGTSVRDLAGRIGPMTLPSAVPWGQYGQLGAVPAFLDISSYATISYTTSASFTIEVWFWRVGNPNTFGTLLGDLSGNNWLGDHNLNLEFDGTGGSYGVGTFTNGAWSHCVVSQPGASGSTLYLNATTSASSIVAIPAGTLMQYVGSDTFADNLNGAIGLLRIWDGRALTAGEVAELYRDPFGMLTPVLPRRFWLRPPASAGAAFQAAPPRIVGQALNRAASF